MSAPATDEPRPDLFARALSRWTAALAAHRVALTVVLVVAGVVFSSLSARVRWEADVLAFFAGESADVRDVRAAAAQPGLVNQLRLDVSLESGDFPALASAARDLAARLRADPAIRTVWAGVDEPRIAAAAGALNAQGVALLDDAERDALFARATPAFLKERVSRTVARVVDPDGEVALAQLRADPLGVSDVIAGKLRALEPGGTGATLRDGLLTSADGRHVMLVLEPAAPPSHQRAAEAVTAAVDRAVDAARVATPALRVGVVGAHRAYAENAQRVTRDVSLVTSLGTILVAAALYVYFRRLPAVLVCLVPPAVGVGLALGLAGLFGVTLPLIVLGFGGLLCGSTTDYGIQLIAAARRRAARLGDAGMDGATGRPVWDPAIPAAAARGMLGPVSMSVATSVAGFAALGLAGAPGLRALGLFVAGATLCIWAITFLVLPAYLGPWVLPVRAAAARARGPRPWHRSWRLPATAALVIATVALTAHALTVRFTRNPRALDGMSPAAQADERAFFATWGDLRHRGVVLVRAATADALLARLSAVHAFLAGQVADGTLASVLSPAPLLPADATAAARRAAWAAHWTPYHVADLRRTLAEATATVARENPDLPRLSPAAFDRFLASLPSPPPVPPANERLAASPAALFPGLLSADPPTAAVLVRMDASLAEASPRLATSWAGELRLRFPDVSILSGDVFFLDATDRARAEAESLAPWTFLAILLPLWVYFRRVARAALAATCLVVGLLWVLGAAHLVAGGLNLLSLVPVLFTLGVAVDYGIYAASTRAADPAAPGANSRNAATFMCALTTILGTGALVVARHPVLYWLGITLCAGVAGGYLTSLLVVAPLAQRPPRTSPRPVWRRAAGYAGRTLLVGCAALLAVPPIAEWVMRRRDAAVAAAPLPSPVQTAPQTWKFGSAWMARRSTVWEMAVTGTPAEIGAASGALGGPIDLRIENEMLDQLDRFVPSLPARWLITRAMGANLLSLPGHVTPDLVAEIAAAAHSHPDPHAYLAPSYPRVLSYHALHDVSQMLIDNPLLAERGFACTGIIAPPGDTADGHLYLARLFDFEGGDTFARHKSVTWYHPVDGVPFVSIAWPGLSGVVTGMNREKIALFINAAATRDFRRVGEPTILLCRRVLQHARTLDEAVAMTRAADVFVSDIIVIADGKTGRAAVVEKSPADTAVRDLTARAAVTNHFLSPRFAADPVNQDRLRRGTTGPRLARAEALLAAAPKLTPAALVAILRDKRAVDGRDIGLGNRNAIDGLIACHGVIMDVTAGRLWVADYPHAAGRFLCFDAAAMLAAPPASPAAPDDALGLPADPILASGEFSAYCRAAAACQRAARALESGDAAAATEAAREAVGLNPNGYLGHELLGRALLAAGDRSAAAAELDRALALDPPYEDHRAALRELLTRCTAR